MKRFFQKIPFPFKLLLIGLIPLVFFTNAGIQLYNEKTQKLHLLKSYRANIRQSADINHLVAYLQEERRSSYDYVLKRPSPRNLIQCRQLTDSIIHNLEMTGMRGFRDYTFLDKLDSTRSRVNQIKITPEEVMDFYTNSIYRINTLNEIPQGSDIYLEPFYKNLAAQKILSEMITSFGIIRSNVYNVLYTKKYMVETLFGMTGVYNVYKTYEKELRLKASPELTVQYDLIRNRPPLEMAMNYLDSLFYRFSFTGEFEAEKWWSVSQASADKLIQIQRAEWAKVNRGLEQVIKKETNTQRRSLIFISLSFMFLVFLVGFIIYSISDTLLTMKQAAEKIATGDVIKPLKVESNDVIADLANSITNIDRNNKLLVNAANHIGNGNFNVNLQPRGPRDVLVRSLLRMKENLLESSSKLRRSREELRALASHLQDVREQERINIAREVHDVLGQQITCVKMDIMQAAKKISRENLTVTENLRTAISLLDETALTVRKIASSLRPSILDDFGLPEALEWQSREFQSRSGINVNFSSRISETEIPPGISTGLFRIYQESLTNVARHADATNVTATLGSENGQIVLSISDNGKGFDLKKLRDGKTLGLLGMKERAAMMGGKFQITSDKGKGTTIIIRIPMAGL